MKNVNTHYKDIITSFLLNTSLQHVGKSWIIETREQLKYDMDKHNPYWITVGIWYNTSICKKLHGTVFGEYIRNAITDIYNIMCSIDAHEKQKPSSIYDGISGGGNALPSLSTA